MPAVQRCFYCDGIQPAEAAECEVCGAELDGVRAERPPRREATAKAKATSPEPRPDGAGGVGRNLGAFLRAELMLLGIATVAVLAASVFASLALTFAAPHARIGASLAASWHYLWRSLLIGAALALGATAVYAVVQGTRRRGPWSQGVSAADWLLGAFVPTAFVISAARTGSVPPSAWTLVPLLAALGFVATLAIRFLADRSPRPRAKLAGLLICAAAFALAILAAPVTDVPARADQRQVDHGLARSVPMTRCRALPVASKPARLLRDSLLGSVRCHAGGMRGRFLSFRNDELLAIFVSEMEYEALHDADARAEHCHSPRGPFADDWVNESDRATALGRIICFGRGRRATIAWSDERTDVFSIVRGADRDGLYRWWHLRQVSPRR